jgi:hypothetical protein
MEPIEFILLTITISIGQLARQILFTLEGKVVPVIDWLKIVLIVLEIANTAIVTKSGSVGEVVLTLHLWLLMVGVSGSLIIKIMMLLQNDNLTSSRQSADKVLVRFVNEGLVPSYLLGLNCMR